MVQTFKKLDILMTPHMDKNFYLDVCDVEMTLEIPDLKADECLADIWKEVSWVPRCRFGKEGLRAEDAAGSLALTISEKKDNYGFDHKYWSVNRATEGDVTIRYRFYPQGKGKFVRSHPYFDTIPEENGAIICGVTSLVNVPEQTYHISLRWDLRDTPEGTKAASTYGSGDVTFDGSCQIYTFLLMIVGRYKMAEAGGKYRVYWLNDNLPDQARMERQLPELLQVIFRYFHEENTPYSVFLRKEPYEQSGGGTGFPGAFEYGYSDGTPFNMDSSLNILAHETVHRWTNLQNFRGEGVWFNEGMAEYYSMMIPLRSGIATPQQVAQWLTKKSVRYYSNPFQTMPIEEIYQKTWADKDNVELQEAPYGRGMFYLMELDRQMKERYGGQKSVDDLIFQTIEIAKKRGPFSVKVSEWEKILERELGSAAIQKFHEIMNGKFMEPCDAWLDGMFTHRRGHFGLCRGREYDNAVIWEAK